MLRNPEILTGARNALLAVSLVAGAVACGKQETVGLNSSPVSTKPQTPGTETVPLGTSTTSPESTTTQESTTSILVTTSSTPNQTTQTTYSTTPETQQPVTISPNTTTTPTTPRVTTTITNPGKKTYTEIQQFGANTFSDYVHVTGMGPYLPIGAHVEVDCLAIGPVEAAPSAKGKWYHMVGPNIYVDYYAAANTFENGDTSGPLESQPAVDPNVPLC